MPPWQLPPRCKEGWSEARAEMHIKWRGKPQTAGDPRRMHNCRPVVAARARCGRRRQPC